MEYGRGECFTPDFSFNIGQNKIAQMRNLNQDNEPISMSSNQKPSVKNSLGSNTVRSSVTYSTSNPVVVKKIEPFSSSPLLQCKPVVFNEVDDMNVVSKSDLNAKQSHLNLNKRKRKLRSRKVSSSKKRGVNTSDDCSKNVTKFQQSYNNLQQLKPQPLVGYNYHRHIINVPKSYPSLFSQNYRLPSSQGLPYKNSPPWQSHMNWNFTDYRFLYQNKFDSHRCNHYALGSKLDVHTLPKVTQPKKLGPQLNRRKIRYPFKNIYRSRKRGNNTGSYRKKVVSHQGNSNNYFQKPKPILPLMNYNYHNYGQIKTPVSASSSVYRPRFNGAPFNNLPSLINYNTYNNYYQFKGGSSNTFDFSKTYFGLNQSNNSHNFNYNASYFYQNKPTASSLSFQNLFSRSPLFGLQMRGSMQKNIGHRSYHHHH